MNINILTQLDQLEGIASEWAQLALTSEHKSPLLTYEWLSCFFEINIAEGDWFVVVAHHHGKLCAVLPLVKSTFRFLGVVIPCLSLPRNDYTLSVDMLVKTQEEACIEQLFAAAFRAYPPAKLIDFSRIDGVSRSLRWILNNKPILATADKSARGGAILIDKNYEQYERELKKNFRKNLSRWRNQLNALDGVDFVYDETSEVNEETLNSIFNVEHSGWKGAGGTSILSDAKTELFFRTLAPKMAKQGWLSLQLLTGMNNKPLAGNFSLKFAQSMLVWKLGYSDAHQKLSPGSLLMDDLIRREFESKETCRVDLMTYEDWYANWNMDVRPFFNLWVFRPSFIGLIYSLALKSRLLLAVAKARLTKSTQKAAG